MHCLNVKSEMEEKKIEDSNEFTLVNQGGLFQGKRL